CARSLRSGWMSLLAWLCLVCMPGIAAAEDGYELWLRYLPLPEQTAQAWRSRTTRLVMDAGSPTRAAARDELRRGMQGLLGAAPPASASVDADGSLIVGTPESSTLIRSLDLDLRELGN